MEYGSLADAGITAADVEQIVCGWGANVVRVPFNQEWALGRAGYDPSAYLADLDSIVDSCAALGAYTLLDLQWLDAETVRGRNSDGSNNFVAPLPNLDSIELWRQLAARYADEPAVLYDVFNEPHDALPDDPVPLIGMRDDGTTFPLRSRRVRMEEWRPWAVQLVGAIRRENPAALIFVSGTNWGYDLRGFPLEETTGIVYSTHVYRNKGNDWDAAFGWLAAHYPVFAAEMGGGDEDLEWGASLLEYCERHGIGWTAWSWSDRPRLIEPPLSPEYLLPEYRATAFGELVRNALRPGTQ